MVLAMKGTSLYIVPNRQEVKVKKGSQVKAEVGTGRLNSGVL